MLDGGGAVQGLLNLLGPWCAALPLMDQGNCLPPTPPPCAPHEHTPHRPSTTPTPSLPAALPGAVFSMEDSLVLIQALLQTAPEGADSSQAKATYVYNAMSLSHQP